MALTVASYNILADAYVRPEWFPHTPSAMLEPGARTGAIAQRVRDLDADVACLQEVERAAFEAIRDFLAPDYDAWFAKKSDPRPDGCATFVRAESARACRSAVHHYADGSGHLALVVSGAFEGRRIAIANTHARWSPDGTPDAEHFGFRQLTELDAARAQLDPAAQAWIVCGDMNVEPDAPIVAELARRGFDHAHRGTGARTCNANGRAKLIDYVFHSPELRAEALPVAPIDDDTPLPSEAEPSDHLPLAARFEWAGALARP